MSLEMTGRLECRLGMLPASVCLQGRGLRAQERPPGAAGPAGSDGHRDPGSDEGQGRGVCFPGRDWLSEKPRSVPAGH